MKSILLALCVILTACSASEPPITLVTDSGIPPMPGALRRACMPIPEIAQEVDLGMLVTGYGQLVDLYTQCRLLNDAKIDWLKLNNL